MVPEGMRCTRSAGAAVLALLAILAGGGCGHVEPAAPAAALGAAQTGIVILSPASGAPGPVDTVTVLWDGRPVFDGKVPIGSGDGDSIPMELARLPAEAGCHVLEVEYGSERMRLEVTVTAGERRRFMLFWYARGGQRSLVHELGPEIGFL